MCIRDSLRTVQSLFIRTPPNVILFCLPDQFFPELGMSYGDNGLRLFPGGKALQVHNAVFRHQIVDVGPGVGYDGTRIQNRKNTRFQLAGTGSIRGGAADKALPSLGKIRTQNKVQLAARTTDCLLYTSSP